MSQLFCLMQEVFNVAICLVEGINNATQNKSTESAEPSPSVQ